MNLRLLLLLFTLCASVVVAAQDVIRLKVVVVTMFESGEDTGDRPGELQFWVEREQLTRVWPFPQGDRDLRTNADDSILRVVTGVGTAHTHTHTHTQAVPGPSWHWGSTRVSTFPILTRLWRGSQASIRMTARSAPRSGQNGWSMAT